jgi:hypothetical protein
LRTQYIEERLPQTVASRPQHLPLQAAQHPAPVFPGNYAHEKHPWNHGCKRIHTDKNKSEEIEFSMISLFDNKL